MAVIEGHTYQYRVQVFDLGPMGEVRLDDDNLVVEAFGQRHHLTIVKHVEAMFPGHDYWMNYQRLAA